MKLFFLPSSDGAVGGAGSSDLKKKTHRRKSKRTPSPSRSDPPSFGSSNGSYDSAATTPRTVLPSSRRLSLIGRNASCLDAEYDYASELGGGSSSSSSSSLRRGGDGKFSREELELVLRRLGGGVREEYVAELLAEADRNGDGRISLESLVVAQEAAEEEELRVAFGVYDANGDGKISAEELWGVFKMIGDESCSIDDCRRMIGGVDSDGDGLVCFRDFARMMSTTTCLR